MTFLRSIQPKKNTAVEMASIVSLSIMNNFPPNFQIISATVLLVPITTVLPESGNQCGA